MVLPLNVFSVSAMSFNAFSQCGQFLSMCYSPIVKVLWAPVKPMFVR
jgi:hypothetical protein